MTNNNPFTPAEMARLSSIRRTVDIYSKHFLIEGLINHAPSQVVIAGGMFESLINGRMVNDIDVFLLDHESPIVWSGLVTKYGLKKSYNFSVPTQWHAIIYNMIVGLNPNIVFDDETTKIEYHSGVSDYSSAENMNIPALTLSTPGYPKVQIILSKHKFRKELIDNFDFKHCCVNYYEHKMRLSKDTFDAINNRMLIKNGTSVPSLARTSKFLHLGYTWIHN